MAIEILSNTFSGPDRSGISFLNVVGNGQRYSVLTPELLQSNGLYEHISSAELFSSAAADANLFFFTNDDYSGNYLQLVDTGANGDILASFAGPIKSGLLIASNQVGVIEQRFSFRALFQAQWDTFIDNTLNGTRASRVGEPTLTWQMFPENVEGLPSNYTFLKIYQPLNIDVPDWPDYSASLTYYIFMFPNFNHNLRAWVDLSETWVESGLFHDEIYADLAPKVDNGGSVLMQQINDGLSFKDGSLGTVIDVYYLPGNQVNPEGTGLFGGLTDDDTTIVVVSAQN
jgi:hypothetical protein